MPLTKTHTLDGEIEEMRVIFTPSGPQLVEVVQSWEADEKGEIIPSSRLARQERVDPADLTPQQRGLLTALASLKDVRKQRRFG